MILKISEFKEKCLGIEIISNPTSIHVDPTINVTSSAKIAVINKDKEDGPPSPSLSNDKMETGQNVSLA